MKKSVIVTSAICLALASSMFLSSCNKNQTVSNEDTAFVVSSEALDGVFNPFFYTTGPDGTIVGQTQIGMLSTDKEGKIVYGQDEQQGSKRRRLRQLLHRVLVCHQKRHQILGRERSDHRGRHFQPVCPARSHLYRVVHAVFHQYQGA